MPSLSPERRKRYRSRNLDALHGITPLGQLGFRIGVLELKIQRAEGNPPEGLPAVSLPDAEVERLKFGHKEKMGTIFGHTQWLTMNGQDPPVPTNMVDLDPTIKDVYGFPVSRVTYAIDGSVFPTSGGYNPTLTIEALAWRAAKGIARRHGFSHR